MQQVLESLPILSKTSGRTQEQRAELLRKANILDANGGYVVRFFSSETLAKDKARQNK